MFSGFCGVTVVGCSGVGCSGVVVVGAVGEAGNFRAGGVGRIVADCCVTGDAA